MFWVMRMNLVMEEIIKVIFLPKKKFSLNKWQKMKIFIRKFKNRLAFPFSVMKILKRLLHVCYLEDLLNCCLIIQNSEEILIYFLLVILQQLNLNF